MVKTEKKIGDEITTTLRQSTTRKVKIVGKIKSIKVLFGRKIYVITGGVAEDFSISPK